jgi:hypothetical protein
MPDNLDVTDLIRAHGDRMTPEQLNWLQNFTQRWDNEVDGSPAGQGIEARMIEEYDQWLSNNRLQPDPLANLFDDLEPDPTAVANRPGQQGLAENYNTFREALLADIRDRNVDIDLIDANRLVESIREPQHISSPLYQLADVERQALADYVQQNGWEREFRAQDPLANLRQGEGAIVRLDQVPDERVYELATRYDVPPGMVRNILTEINGPTARMVELQEQAANGAGRFETLPAASRDGVVFMIDDLLAERDRAPAQLGQANDPRDLSIAQRLLDIEREPDGSLRQGGIDATAYALQTGQLDHPLVNHIPPGPERARALEPVLRAFIEQVVNERQQAQLPAPAQPAARARRVTFNEFNGDLTFREAEQRIQQIASDPAYTVRQLRRLSGLIENPDHPQFRVLDQDQINGLNAIIDGGLQQRRQGRQALAQPAPTQPAAQLAERLPIPREVQVMAMQDLVQGMTPAWNRQAQELADTYFNDNVIDGNDVTISALSGMLRNYRVGPHANSPFEVRELAARKLEALHTSR